MNNNTTGVCIQKQTKKLTGYFLTANGIELTTNLPLIHFSNWLSNYTKLLVALQLEYRTASSIAA